MSHRFGLRVYYEDTDVGGIVYHANYLKFIERARSEWVRALGVDQVALRAAGQVFAVVRIEADYVAPGRYDDLLEVETVPEAVGPARAVLVQRVLRGGRTLFAARVTLACLGPSGRPVRLPAALAAAGAPRLGDKTRP
ncbi:tol-pal system-associated acyl-CoA thioesterase [Wenxinia marina]|uniref:Tol-pal system-associated acyl-CoA thioesterase n=1 Tax=Wenxinia marina DSM 24838 TaxID=1123501 RepID=A0A0D0NJB3_9RHOB|nr:tol-pal system-associated acyl-CoA thioesterase [Wenxinia marina]KIQ68430.1 tol-pal system-associated acyl-CoA thioesterase [Wenxinia marina DSM 24838]GGL72338.1 tol-pal system-associated acyl-CoA thioesterase [Wenxinia marina]